MNQTMVVIIKLSKAKEFKKENKISDGHKKNMDG